MQAGGALGRGRAGVGLAGAALRKRRAGHRVDAEQQRGAGTRRRGRGNRVGLLTISRSWGSAMSLGSIFQRHVALRYLHPIKSRCASDIDDDR